MQSDLRGAPMPTTDVRSPNRVLSERIQFVGCAIVVVFVVGWICWFLPFDDLLDQSGTPLGADFSMFYVAGQVVRDGAGDQLYDQAEHQRRLQQLFPAIDPSFALPYRYPPCVAALMAPLTALPYAAAYAVFLALSCAAWWMAACQLVSVAPEVRKAWGGSLRWTMLGWPVALETLVGGQASMFALLIAVSVYALLRNQRFVCAGAILALAAYKPNVLALLALGCLIRYPRMWKGFLPAAVGVGIFCLVPDGWNGLIQYRELTANLATQAWDVATPQWKVHGLAPWFHLVCGDDGRLACGLIGLAATFFAAVRWPSKACPYAQLHSHEVTEGDSLGRKSQEDGTMSHGEPRSGGRRGPTWMNGSTCRRFATRVCFAFCTWDFRPRLSPGAASLLRHRTKIRGARSTSHDRIEPIWFAVLISLNALFNAYTPVYDLVLLLAGAVLTAEHLALRDGPNVGRMLATAQFQLAIIYFGPHLSQAIAKVTGAQPFSVVFAALAVWQCGLLLQSLREPAAVRGQLLTSVSG